MRTLLTFCLLFTFVASFAQWNDVSENDIQLRTDSEREIIPSEYRVLSLDLPTLKEQLAHAPLERSGETPLSIHLPLPDGTMEAFTVFESPIMMEGIAARYPNLKTYKGKGLNNPAMIVRFDDVPSGFHASILSPKGNFYIDPYADNQTEYYISYYTKNYTNNEIEQLSCGNALLNDGSEENIHATEESSSEISDRSGGGSIDLFTYRLALASTGEFAEFHGATTKEEVMDVYNIIVNRVNLIFERDLGVRMLLIDNTDEVIFLNPNTDPYSDGTDVGTCFGENQIIINQNVGGFNNYDLGHVLLSVCNGSLLGLGSLNALCGDTRARGASCQNSPTDPFIVRILCHEIGHQLTGTHSWNYCIGNEDNQQASSAYEPASGTTIMSYSGVCGPGSNIPASSTEDDYYHVSSLEQAWNRIRSSEITGCELAVPVDNACPEVSIPLPNDLVIPISTPFELTGEATDEEGDPMTYSWEQYDLGPSLPLTQATGSMPLFRSLPPSDSPTRIFPSIGRILSFNNETDNMTERLPFYERVMTFRFIVRDNNVDAGAVDWAEIQFDVSDTAGPFAVSSYNSSGINVQVGDFIPVTWDVANTNNSTVNCQRVDIFLSVDGGFTYPYTLAEDAPNDGEHFVYVPDVETTTARIKVKAANNIFFDISNNDFSISPATEASYTIAASPVYHYLCLPDNPSIPIATSSILGFDMPISFSVTDGLPAGATATFSSNEVLPSEETVLTLNFDNAVEGYYIVEIEASADNVVTQHYLSVETVTNDFSALTLTSPIDGLSGVGLQQNFEWTTVSDANTYDIEIATSPAFGASIVDGDTDLTDNNFLSADVLEAGTIYYWRVRPKNECGFGEANQIFTFSTEVTSCNPFVSNQVPVNIPSSGTPTVESTIFVAQDFIINDLKVTHVNGVHDLLSHIRISLLSPSGTEVRLINSICPGNFSTFDAAFDDDSILELPCPPNGGTYPPNEPLSSFIGESSEGTWTLKVRVLFDSGSGGSLQNWGLEFCSNTAISSPSMIINQTMPVAPLASRIITNEFLLTEDDNNSPAELTYVLVTLPAKGDLRMFGNTLNVGDSFTQSQINQQDVTYYHTGDVSDETDSFLFTVSDGEGGWISSTAFNIIFDENAPISTGIDEDVFANQINIYPNPADKIITLTFENINLTDFKLELLTIDGKIIQEYPAISTEQQINVNTADLPAGIYLVRVKTDNGVAAKKVLIQH